MNAAHRTVQLASSGGRAVLVAAAFVCLAAGGSARAADPEAGLPPIIDVAVDEAQVLKINRTPRSIIVGNPLIADAVVEENGLLILIGRNYGTTNLIALDETGDQIARYDIVVRTSGSNAVSLFRGTARYSLNCAPRCEAELDIGDEVAHYDALRTQIDNKITLSRGQTEADR